MDGPGHFDFHLHLSQYWADPEVNRYDSSLDFSLAGLLAEMDSVGVASGLLLQLDTVPTVEETLREGGEMFARSEGRLLRTSTINPTLGTDEVERAVRLWEAVPDLRAIKLYPGYFHFYPHDARLEPVYDFAARRKIPVMFHQGDTLDPSGLVKYARPLEIDEVAVRRRDVNLVICHFGNPWVEEAAEMVYKNENVYADTSGLVWSPKLPRYDRQVARAQRRLQNAVDAIGDVRRVLYGSDWPLVALRLSVGLVEGLELSDREKAQVLGGNARRLLGLPP